jgi:hypothetical protein
MELADSDGSKGGEKVGFFELNVFIDEIYMTLIS